MNRHQLQQRLVELDVSPRAYSLLGGLPSEEYVLGRESGRWQVYYSERGQKSGLVEFDDEAAACQHLLSLLEGDRTTRIKPTP